MTSRPERERAGAALPARRRRRRWLPRVELVRRLRTSRADAGLRSDLDRLAGDTTDDLPTR